MDRKGGFEVFHELVVSGLWSVARKTFNFIHYIT
jgi:hypothetical protein